MNIKSRIKKLENSFVKENSEPRTAWDFSRTTTAQLLKLKELLTGEGDAAAYTQQLIGEGYLNYRIVK